MRFISQNHDYVKTGFFHNKIPHILCACFCLNSVPLLAEEPYEQDMSLSLDQGKPKWEIGIFGGGLDNPTYPGSGDSKSRGIILPYAVYRSENFSIGDGGIINAKAIKKPFYDVTLSLSGGFNVDEEEDTNRDGMPGVDYTFGIGPKLRLYLQRPNDKQVTKHAVNFDLQSRAIFATDFSDVEYIGYVIEPQFSINVMKPLKLPINFSTSVSMSWASEGLQDYLYQVDPEFATPIRPAFDAQKGWMQARWFVGLSKSFKDYGNVFLGVGAQTYQFAENENSPLIKTDIDYTAVLGFRWRIFASEDRVP
ncbi:MAG: MipA/OmpV family protein [Pseudomonadota bacterium]